MKFRTELRQAFREGPREMTVIVCLLVAVVGMTIYGIVNGGWGYILSVAAVVIVWSAISATLRWARKRDDQ